MKLTVPSQSGDVLEFLQPIRRGVWLFPILKYIPDYIVHNQKQEVLKSFQSTEIGFQSAE
jgi:hypothetical protein